MISDVTNERHAKRNGTIWFIDLNVSQNGRFGLMFRQNLANIRYGICASTNKYAYIHPPVSVRLTKGIAKYGVSIVNIVLFETCMIRNYVITECI